LDGVFVVQPWAPCFGLCVKIFVISARVFGAIKFFCLFSGALVLVWLLHKSLSARTTTPEKFLLLFYQPFHAQEALGSTLKLQNVSPRITPITQYQRMEKQLLSGAGFDLAYLRERFVFLYSVYSAECAIS
jgi:hypothetical protein